MKKDTYVVIAAYNEAKTIGKVIDGLKKEGYSNIVVIDDGSKDKTFIEAKKHGAITLRHIINRGQGAALQTGITYSLLKNAKYIIHFDADGQHNPKDIEKLLIPIRSNKVDVCLGSRFLKKQKIPFKRKLILKGAVLIMWIFYGVRLTDAHNGLRAFSNKAAKRVIITSDRMEHASEIIEKIKTNNLKYKEVPVTIKYTKETLENGRKGQGNFDSLKILIKMILKKMGV